MPDWFKVFEIRPEWTPQCDRLDSDGPDGPLERNDSNAEALAKLAVIEQIRKWVAAYVPHHDPTVDQKVAPLQRLARHAIMQNDDALLFDVALKVASL